MKKSSLSHAQRAINDPKFADILCYVFAAFLGVYPVSRHMPGIGIGYFTIGGLILIYLSPVLLKNKRLFLRDQYFFALFILIHVAFLGLDPSARSIKLVITLVSVIMFYVVLTNLAIPSDVLVRMLAITAYVTGAILSALIFTHRFIHGSEIMAPHFAGTGSLGHKNQLAFFSAILFSFVYGGFTRKPSAISFLLLSVFVYGTYYSNSRGGVVGILLVIVVFAILPGDRRKSFISFGIARLILVLLLCALALFPGKVGRVISDFNATKAKGAFIDMATDSDQRRKGFVMDGLAGFTRNPLGHGLGSFRRDHRGYASHNDYVKLLYETGALGFILFVAILTRFTRALLRIRNRVPDDLWWLWKSLFVGLCVIIYTMNIKNIYNTMAVWFVFSGIEILRQYATPGPSNSLLNTGPGRSSQEMGVRLSRMK